MSWALKASLPCTWAKELIVTYRRALPCNSLSVDHRLLLTESSLHMQGLLLLLPTQLSPLKQLQPHQDGRLTGQQMLTSDNIILLAL